MQEPEASNTPMSMSYFPLRRYGITVQTWYSRKLRGGNGSEESSVGFLWPESSTSEVSHPLPRGQTDAAAILVWESVVKPRLGSRPACRRASSIPGKIGRVLSGPDLPEPDRRRSRPAARARSGSTAARLAGGARARLPRAGAGAGRRPGARRRISRRWRRGPTSPCCGSPPPASSRSRNAALDAARGEILLVADDDVTHPPGAYAGIRRFFAENPGLDLFVGRSLDPDGRPRKRPLPRRRPLTRLNAARASSHEIALRLAPGARRRPALRRGLRRRRRHRGHASARSTSSSPTASPPASRGVHDPLPVSVHPAESSGFVWEGAAQARARALVFARVFGRAAPPVRLAFALKNARRFAQPGRPLGLPARLSAPYPARLASAPGEVVGEVPAGARPRQALDLAVERPGRPRRAELVARERAGLHPVVGEHLGQARGRRAPAAAARSQRP